MYYIRAINLYDIVSRNRHKLKRLYYIRNIAVHCTSYIYRYIDRRTIRLLLYFISLPLYVTYIIYSMPVCGVPILYRYTLYGQHDFHDATCRLRGIQQKSRSHIAAIANTTTEHCNNCYTFFAIYIIMQAIIYIGTFMLYCVVQFFFVVALRGRT